MEAKHTPIPNGEVFGTADLYREAREILWKRRVERVAAALTADGRPYAEVLAANLARGAGYTGDDLLRAAIAKAEGRA